MDESGSSEDNIGSRQMIRLPVQKRTAQALKRLRDEMNEAGADLNYDELVMMMVRELAKEKMIDVGDEEVSKYIDRKLDRDFDDMFDF